MSNCRGCGSLNINPWAGGLRRPEGGFYNRFMDVELQPLFEAIADPARVTEWQRCVLLRSRPNGGGWSKATASPVILRDGPAVKLVLTIGRREETETIPPGRWPARLEALTAEPIERAHVQADDADWHARRTKKGRWLVTRGKPSSRASALPAHDRERRYPLPPDHPAARRLFVATGLLSPEGNLRSRQADKYRQVQHYVELLRSLPVWDEARRSGRPVRIVDAGCGKAYMSLALYAYGEIAGVSVELTGLDADVEVVDKVRALAEELGYQRTRFAATRIWDFAERAEDERFDLLVSLHACDTATDEAIAAGVRLGAQSIVVAPCCHRELGRQMRDGELWSPALEHRVLRDRLADIVTDSLRASALETLGFRAEVIEFVAAEHTAKNLMIRASRRPEGADTRRLGRAAWAEYRRLADAWSVRPALERLLADELALAASG